MIYVQSVASNSGLFIDWDDKATWNTGAVPDSLNDGVIINSGASASWPFNIVNLDAGDAVSIGSLNVNAGNLAVYGSLSVAGGVTATSGQIILHGGSLSGSHIVLAGGGGIGAITSSGAIENYGGDLYSSDASAADGQTFLTITGATFYNTGTLEADDGSTLLVQATQAGGLLNVCGGVLSGGAYVTSGGTIDLKTDGVITTLATTLQLDGAFNSYDPATHAYVPIEASLNKIAATGSLWLLGDQFASPGSITIDGTVEIYYGGSLTAHALVIDQGGEVAFQNTPNGPGLGDDIGSLVNNGRILVNAPGAPTPGTDLLIESAVTGGGAIILSAGTTFTLPRDSHLYNSAATVDLEQAVSNNITFSDGTGTVILGRPQSFTGGFQGFVAGDTIELKGFSMADVTATSYADGVLTVEEKGTAIKLAFAGAHSLADFSLTAGSHTSPSVDIVGVAAA